MHHHLPKNQSWFQTDAHMILHMCKSVYSMRLCTAYICFKVGLACNYMFRKKRVQTYLATLLPACFASFRSMKAWAATWTQGFWELGLPPEAALLGLPNPEVFRRPLVWNTRVTRIQEVEASEVWFSIFSHDMSWVFSWAMSIPQVFCLVAVPSRRWLT